MVVSDVYEKLQTNSGLQLIFLDENLNPVVVKSIEKVDYSGKILGNRL
ncbi:MAG: hypothetical protein QMD14_05565 [Candidatus Aenigmarchaeota archaeon]|nr:hypothetical protein [Candidatus Aenigmarchaeota archaeon]